MIPTHTLTAITHPSHPRLSTLTAITPPRLSTPSHLHPLTWCSGVSLHVLSAWISAPLNNNMRASL